MLRASLFVTTKTFATIKPLPSLRLTSKAFASTAREHLDRKVLHPSRINANLSKAQYAVRGEVVKVADQLGEQLKKDPNSLPFKEITYCNIGNPQQLKQIPLSFPRQVLALCTDPELLKLTNHFPSDAIARANALLKAMPGGTGTYSHSQGVDFIRKDVAKFIEERDGFPSDSEHIFLSNGASPAIQNVLNALIRQSSDPAKPTDGILIPIPQYPLYTASIALFGGAPVPYFLDEYNAWSLSAADLTASVKKARENGITVRGLVIINPGNPTGQVLSIENMREIVEFCYREKIVLLADEVYQENVYGNKPFHSFKKVLRSMGGEIAVNQELFSFHSISKGFFGECGRRGGYVECVNVHPLVRDELYKIASISLCPNVDGQVTLDTMVRPPREGEPSYPAYKRQRDEILASLKRRALSVAAGLNKLEGVRCNDAEGAMYLFPQITLPPKAVAAAKEVNKSPDLFYCLSLLNSTGLVVVPGSGFGQKEGTYHFRTTFLPPEDQINSVLASLAKFHHDFMRQYQ